MGRRWLRLPLLIVLVGVTGLAGCGGEGARSAAGPTASAGSPTSIASSVPGPSPSAVVAGTACRNDMPGGAPVVFGVNGATNLGGVVVGTGTTAVLLAHERNKTLCMWAGYAMELSRAGYRVLAVDLPGAGASRSAGTVSLDEAVTAGVALLRSQGAQRVLLVGASMGGTAVVAAAAGITPPVAGVVSLSGPHQFYGVDALAAAPKLAAPVLYAACRSDSDFAESAQRLHAATSAQAGARLLVEECTEHGVAMLTLPKIKSEVTAFLKARAG